MKKIIKLLFIFLIINQLEYFYPSIFLQNYNTLLYLPSLSPTIENKNQEEVKNGAFFSFRAADIDSNLSILGFWRIKIGVGLGFTLFPELRWIMTYPNLNKGLIFEQSRLFSLDWKTENGIFLHLFFDDDIDNTVFTFKFEQDKLLRSFYITNKISEIEINPFRHIRQGKSTDITTGITLGNHFYKADFAIQLSSVKPVIERFTGSNKEISKKLLSNQYVRGIFYYLPDKNLTGNILVYQFDPEYEIDYPDIVINGKKFKKLTENTDYIIDRTTGTIKFRDTSYKKLTVIYYQTNINGSIYSVGNTNSGKNAINGTIDFDKTTNPEYFLSEKGRDYLILSFINEFSIFEEKNSYQVTEKDAVISNFSALILTKDNIKASGFNVDYDSYTGCIRITRNKEKGTTYNIYPFFDYVDPSTFYLTFFSPDDSKRTHFIDFNCVIKNSALKLSSKPISSTIKIFYNSILLDNSKYYYDTNTGSVTINFETGSTDIIEIYYLTDQDNGFNLNAAIKNQFKLNKFLFIGDSLWYKMPLKLWEESYYDKMHSAELLYFVNLKYDLKPMFSADNVQCNFNVATGFSFFYPELKGLTIIEDFEREIKGYKLSLNYSNWFPVNLPPNSIFPELITSTKGRLYFRNMHKDGIYSDDTFLSIYDSNVPSRANYTNGSLIGPYSSCDGFTYKISENKFIDVKNSLSLLSEFELDPDEAVSIALPVTTIAESIDFTKFNGLNIAIKRDNLSGTVWLFVDAGKITERYNTTDTSTQTELIDEGISYYINESGGFYLYKSKNDGKNITNDFNLNGSLDTDDTSSITRFLESETLSNYYLINKKYNNINFLIEEPDKLKDLRGIRLTLYSPTGATGRLMINQIRFIESSWNYNKTLTSKASEISPIEDSYLLKHIFSKENSEIDSKLHYQRFKERTIKINLTQNEPFYLEKDYISPIDISNFKKISFFVLMQNQSNRVIKITLKDSNGKKASITKDLQGLSKDKWHKIEFYFSSFNNYANINSIITNIRLDFLNETSDTDDNIIYLDEFFMDEAVASWGGAAKSEFIFSNPDYAIKNNNFTIFGNPYLNLNTIFKSANFLQEENTKLKDANLTNNGVISFTFAEINYYLMSKLNFLFQNYKVNNNQEELIIKLFRTKNEVSPLTFLIFYNYNRYSLMSYISSIENKTETKKLTLELGSDFDIIKFNIGYDNNLSINNTTYYSSSFYTNFNFQKNRYFNRIDTALENNGEKININGFYSLDNLGYLIKDDFINLFRNGDNKKFGISINSGFFLIDPIYFRHSLSVNETANNQVTDEIFLFMLSYSNSIQFDVIIKYFDIENSFFILKYKRSIDNSHTNSFKTLYWNNYFDELGKSINSTNSLFFLPPFSSLYKKNNKSFFLEEMYFDNISDSVLLKWDWMIYTENIYLIPKTFSIEIVEFLKNKNYLLKNYYLNFNTTSENELAFNRNFSISIDYSLSEKINFQENNNSYKSENRISTMLFYPKLEFQITVMHDHLVTDGYIKSSSHEIAFIFSIYKNFYKKREQSNDSYGFDMLYQLDLRSSFHKRFDNLSIFKIDTPIDILFTAKLGYRANKNFIIYSTAKAGYSMDYSQSTLDKINRYGIEFSIEGEFTF